MHIPALLLGLLTSTLYAALFHLWRDGGAGKLLLYLVLSWIGFWAGHLLGGLLGWSFARLGPLNFGLATVVSVVFLLVGHWLSLVEVQRE